MDLSPAPATALALLVDGENLSRDLAPRVLEASRHLGPPPVRRVYGNLAAISGWEDHGFRLCPTRPGKNAADLLLCIEAMALAFRDGFQTLAIASCDRDFSYLAEHLREAGKRVVGIGTAAAAASFRSACTQFVMLDPVPTPALAPPAGANPPAPGDGPVRTGAAVAAVTRGGMLDKVRAVVGTAGPIGFPISALGPALQAQGIRVAETPYKTWRAWLAAHGNVFLSDPKGPDARVRLRP
jgi:hypothetical protein